MAEVNILCPNCRKPNSRTVENFRRARFCQHCGHDVVLNNDGPRYYIVRVIKEGGQGSVYEAIDDTRRVYAVKEMIDRFVDPKERDEAIARFEAEAKMLQGLRHPRIPRIYADFKDEGRHYLVMDFVRGEDLEDIIKREQKIPEAQVLVWADQICDVLEYLHGQRPPVIFRDMKPSNIMIERSGGVKMIDFGIAKVFQQTQRGTQIGTPGYAPPEQYQGIATIESDIYALGATLHHMLTGRDPRDHMPFTFPPVRDLNPAVSQRTAAAVDRAVQKFASDRFHSIAEMHAALQPQPVAPAQVRVRQGTQPIPAAAQVAAAPAVTQPATPAQAAPPPAARPPAPPAARPPPANPAPSSPAPAAVPAPQPAPRQRRRFSVAGLLIALLAIVMIAATLALAFPAEIGRLLPVGPQPQPTAQTFIQQSYTAEDLVVIVPAGVDVRVALTQAYEAKVHEVFGPDARVNYNAPPSPIGEPEQIGEDANGAITYRASVQGLVLVPRT